MADLSNEEMLAQIEAIKGAADFVVYLEARDKVNAEMQDKSQSAMCLLCGRKAKADTIGAIKIEHAADCISLR